MAAGQETTGHSIMERMEEFRETALDKLYRWAQVPSYLFSPHLDKPVKTDVSIDLAFLDPDPYWECGSVSGNRSMEINK